MSFTGFDGRTHQHSINDICNAGCDQKAPASILPTDARERKDTPIVTGVLDYFPRAIAEIARVSKAGNDQHNPGQPLHWARGKSTDHANCIGRHLTERGRLDTDNQRHSAKMAWRALALLETELELEDGIDAEAAAKAEGAIVGSMRIYSNVVLGAEHGAISQAGGFDIKDFRPIKETQDDHFARRHRERGGVPAK